MSSLHRPLVEMGLSLIFSSKTSKDFRLRLLDSASLVTDTIASLRTLVLGAPWNSIDMSLVTSYATFAIFILSFENRGERNGDFSVASVLELGSV